jgi:hypothetical protein
MKNIFPKLFGLMLASLLFVASGVSHAQGANPTITVDENGNGSLVFPGGGTFPTQGVLAPDPGPGGRTAALTYNLLGPPSLVAGDVFLLEPGSNVFSDLIRYNPANGASAASLVFYSDILSGADSLADTGFPTAFYANTLTFSEIGLEGNNGFTYTPTAGQPGFIAGFDVTYVIRSDVGGNQIPEPASLALVSAAILSMAASAALRRRRT